MDHPRSASGIGEENVGIPDDLRCKRSDGKQWRCTAMSMPDKTVCEKHYIQAKKRAANSAMRANLKKAKRKSLGESDAYLESKSDDFDTPLVNTKAEEYSLPVTKTKYFEKISKNQFRYSPETQTTPQVRSFSVRDSPKLNDDSHVDLMQYEENLRSYKTLPVSTMDSSRNRSQRSFDANAMTVSEYSDQSTESSEETGGQTCHQCRRNDRDRVIWCLKCDRRGYCDSCKSKWYPDISPEDIQKICPACRGNCNCKVCLRGDNLIKVRIREIPALDKLQYLHCLLSSVLPVVKQIHHEQCSEVELEKRLRGTEIDLARTRLNVDEQMCCNFCRIPIIDYHRHCANCSYDLCLSCSRDLREASMACINGVVDDKIGGKSQEKETVGEQVPRFKLNFSDKYPDWKANSDSSIPCPPEEYGGCGYSSLNLNRIFKMNWVAKLVKNVEEMVSGCRVYGDCNVEKIVYNDPRHCQYANREEGDDNFLYCPVSEDIKSGGVGEFRRHWAGGEPIIVNQVFDSSSATSWDPMVIWRGIQETADEKLKDGNRMVKATDCFDWSQIDIELGQFIEGYSEGRIHENGRQEMLKLKDWPCPSASEVLLYQRPEFISKLPLLEFIHSKWGLLNVAAKLPHYSLQNDVGPKIFISYGTYKELGRGDSVTNLHFNIRDMVYLLVHTCDVKLSGQQRTTIEKMPHSFKEFQEKDSQGDGKVGVDDSRLPDLSLGECSLENEHCKSLDENKDEEMTDQGIDNTSSVEGDAVIGSRSNENGEDVPEKTRPGVSWDVFRRQDVPKVTEYLRTHQKEFGVPDSETYDFVARPLYDERFYLNGYHKRKLKEEFGVEPWSFEQHLGQAVFVPAGCPFQVRNLQSTVQLGLDFLSPESLGEAVKLAEEIRCLPNDHDAKLQVLEVGKISLYAASSAIKEVQKLVLDPKLGAELGFEDPSLTAAVSDNLEKMTKRRQITCA